MMDYEVFEIPVDMNRLPLEVTRAIENNDSRGYKLADIQRNSYEVPDGSETVSEVWKLVFESHGMTSIRILPRLRMFYHISSSKSFSSHALKQAPTAKVASSKAPPMHFQPKLLKNGNRLIFIRFTTSRYPIIDTYFISRMDNDVSLL